MVEKSENGNEIKVALSYIPYIYFIYEIAGDFEQEYKAKVKITKASSSKAFTLVEDGKADIGVIAKLPDDFDDNKYDKMIIGRDTLKLAVPNSHWLSRKKAVSIKEIAHMLGEESVKFILREEDSGTREQTLALFGKDANLVLHETDVIMDSNEEILATISRSDKYPVKLISLVSSVMCEHIRPTFASLVELKERSFRDFFAIRKKENGKADIFWSFLKGKLDIKLNIEKTLDVLENVNVRNSFPAEYMYNKKLYVFSSTYNHFILPTSTAI